MTYIIKRREPHTSYVWRGEVLYQTKEEVQEAILYMNRKHLSDYIRSIERF